MGAKFSKTKTCEISLFQKLVFGSFFAEETFLHVQFAVCFKKTKKQNKEVENGSKTCHGSLQSVLS